MNARDPADGALGTVEQQPLATSMVWITMGMSLLLAAIALISMLVVHDSFSTIGLLYGGLIAFVLGVLHWLVIGVPLSLGLRYKPVAFCAHWLWWPSLVAAIIAGPAIGPYAAVATAVTWQVIGACLMGTLPDSLPTHIPATATPHPEDPASPRGPTQTKPAPERSFGSGTGSRRKQYL